ncbi:MAG: DHHW family protein [Clostridia bacterium]|nr:DHHW family protein [Clostridia bacterium]
MDNEKLNQPPVASVNKKQKATFTMINWIGILAFFLSMYLIALVALMPFFRTKKSEIEHRSKSQLQAFPKLTVSSLFSGEFFDGLSIWYSDTFPARDTLLRLNQTFRNSSFGGKTRLYGTQESEQADDIPDAVPEQPEETEPEEVLKPQPFKDVAPGKVETVGALLVVDDAAYELYNFGKECADKYAGTVNHLADLLDGKAKVYSMLIPTSIDVMLSPKMLEKYNVNSSYQHKAIEYIYQSISSKVTTVDLYPYLEAHRSEYLYFRTDHHWTANGAFYGYQALMKTLGKTPFELDHYTELKYEGFLGTFYSGSKMDPQLKKHPDTVYAYMPQDVQTFESTYMVNNKSYHSDSTPIIQDADRMSANNKYIAFMGGDRVLDIIRNPQITDGSTCTVVKDSYSNCLIPFLVDHYQTIYVVDPREFPKADKRKLVEFVNETGSQEVFVINNVSATRQKGFINDLINLIE